MEELQFLMKSLKDLDLKRERREMLVGLVRDMKQRGLNIDFAGSSSLFKYGAKNAGESNKKYQKYTKKGSKHSGQLQ
jgi:GH35 family endo-1,4-beta-xylanase